MISKLPKILSSFLKNAYVVLSLSLLFTFKIVLVFPESSLKAQIHKLLGNTPGTARQLS